jgi:hypothetical protein
MLCAGLGAKRFVGRALSRPWSARAERSRREARRSWSLMPMIPSRARSADAIATQRPNELIRVDCANAGWRLGSSALGSGKVVSSPARSAPRKLDVCFCVCFCDEGGCLGPRPVVAQTEDLQPFAGMVLTTSTEPSTTPRFNPPPMPVIVTSQNLVPERGRTTTFLAGPAASFGSLVFVDPDLAALIVIANTADAVVDSDMASEIVE